MPHLGARAQSGNKIIIVKVYGPEANFETSSVDLVKYINLLAESTKELSSCDLAQYIGTRLKKSMTNDHSAVWAEVEVHDTRESTSFGNTFMIREDSDGS